MRPQIASLGQLGRTQEAAEVMAELAEFGTSDAAGFWKATSLYVDPQHHARVLEGLRKAGMPENKARLIAG